MYKLSRQSGKEWIEHSHEPVFIIQTTNSGNERLIVGVPGGDPIIFTALVDGLDPPYFLLYLLHTPRGEGEAGRYQSPELGSEDFHAFLDRFSSFFSADARYDLWVHSPNENATVVWDRHNLIYAYGPVQRFCSILRKLGFDHGEPNILFPHQHHYREEFDADAAAVLSALEWSRTPLRPEDEQ